MTEKEVNDYMGSEQFCRRAHSAEYAQRMYALFERLENEPLTVEQSAKFMNLPVDVFRRIYGAYQAWEAIKPTLGTEH